MSRGQLARTPDNYPRMKDRAFARREGPVASWGGGMWCPCGVRITWGKVGRAEYDTILRELDDHEAYCTEGVYPWGEE